MLSFFAFDTYAATPLLFIQTAGLHAAPAVLSFALACALMLGVPLLGCCKGRVRRGVRRRPNRCRPLCALGSSQAAVRLLVSALFVPLVRAGVLVPTVCWLRMCKGVMCLNRDKVCTLHPPSKRPLAYMHAPPPAHTQPEVRWGGQQCHESGHTLLLLIGALVAVVYLSLSLRLLQAGNSLANISLKLNLFNWSGDRAAAAEHDAARGTHVLARNNSR